jgi:hypothetical protein
MKHGDIISLKGRKLQEAGGNYIIGNLIILRLIKWRRMRARDM